jgi:very-short-patch-repair endonuclease
MVSAQHRTVENELARMGTGAHGIVSRRELLEAGITRAEISWRLRTGALILEFRGVYRVGHRAPSHTASCMAAVKAAGPGALLSGLPAAAFLVLVPQWPGFLEVTAPTERRIEGLRVRRSRADISLDAWMWRGVPVTSIPRTLVDIAGALSDGELARAVHEAQVRFRTTPSDVERVLTRRPASRGAARLRRVIHGDVHVTLSKLEKRFLTLLRSCRLPRPVTNRLVGAHRVDCRWPEHRLTVELDSYRYHSTRYAWEQDRRRDRAARARGDEHRRYDWADVFEDSAFMLAELKTLLRRSNPAAG